MTQTMGGGVTPPPFSNPEGVRMNEQEKAALRARFSTMTVNEQVTELALIVLNPERQPCAKLKGLCDTIHGNGKIGLTDQVRYLRWATTCLAAAVCATPAAGPIYAAVQALLGR